jgi:hypothetical protein
MTYKVIQWTTGNVGRRAVRAILDHPELELVGLYAHSADKAEKDAGDLGGIEKTGVLATGDVEALLSLGADCVSYNPLVPNLDELERMLETGLNVVTTSGFISGRNLGDGVHDRLDQAAKRGGVSIFGGGINPGLMNYLPLVLTAMCDRVHAISMTEAADVRGYASPGTWKMLGWGQPPGAEGQGLNVQSVDSFFRDGLDLMAEALAFELDDRRTEVEFALATRDIELSYMTFPKGTVAGQRSTWQGIARGRAVITLSIIWQMGKDLEPSWPFEGGYHIEIEGEPSIRTRVELHQPSPRELSREKRGMGLSMIATAMPVVNAIPAVCEAAPGVRTYLDLPLIRASHLLYPG